MDAVRAVPLEISLDDAPLLERRLVTVIDTRFPEEIEIFGALAGAHNLPLSCLQRFTGEQVDPPCEEFSARDLTVAERRDLTTALIEYAASQITLLCVCRNGNRSLVAARLIRDLGHPHAVSLKGGLHAWEDWIRALPDVDNHRLALPAEWPVGSADPSGTPTGRPAPRRPVRQVVAASAKRSAGPSDTPF